MNLKRKLGFHKACLTYLHDKMLPSIQVLRVFSPPTAACAAQNSS